MMISNGDKQRERFVNPLNRIVVAVVIYRPTLLLFPYVPNNIICYYYHHHRIHRSALSRPPDLQLLQQSYIGTYTCISAWYTYGYMILLYIMPPVMVR